MEKPKRQEKGKPKEKQPLLPFTETRFVSKNLGPQYQQPLQKRDRTAQMIPPPEHRTEQEELQAIRQALKDGTWKELAGYPTEDVNKEMQIIAQEERRKLRNKPLPKEEEV